MYSIGMALKLKPGQYAEYKRRHDELWPEMERMMHAQDVSMVIYRHEEWLFIHGTAPTEEHFGRTGTDPITPKWNEYMKDVLQVDETGDLIVHELPLAFSFGDFA
ncbi:MAG: L-rhamnose mutarotase [Spirochaetaceae bacterium]|nr:L-rhamnose mutarotase [Spirochaetaceae bacterium]